MTDQQPTREYTNGEITVVWKQHQCIHSGVCFRSLPLVFNPTQRPWVSIHGASTEAIRNTIDRCPSGALSYRMEKEMEAPEMQAPAVKIQVVPDGPLMVTGSVLLTDHHGRQEIKTNLFTLCRCGASLRKPYCDGSHHTAGFKD